MTPQWFKEFYAALDKIAAEHDKALRKRLLAIANMRPNLRESEWEALRYSIAATMIREVAVYSSTAEIHAAMRAFVNDLDLNKLFDGCRAVLHTLPSDDLPPATARIMCGALELSLARALILYIEKALAAHVPQPL